MEPPKGPIQNPCAFLTELWFSLLKPGDTGAACHGAPWLREVDPGAAAEAPESGCPTPNPEFGLLLMNLK